MLGHVLFADRGALVEVEADAHDTNTRSLAAARSGHLRIGRPGISIWVQLRGVSELVAREGHFHLRSGDWIVLDRDSSPHLQAGRHGLTIGWVAPIESPSGGRRGELMTGRGRMGRSDLRIALRLWRAAAAAAANSRAGDDIDARDRGLLQIAQHIEDLQRELEGRISLCPGRSMSRKRQVFRRLQRARLFLEGHCHRVVRLSELAELTSFSSWYLSKTFHEIYRESPQAASVRLRLEHACELLADGDCSISEIGIACGFDNSCSFARAFRSRFGMTASDFRFSRRRLSAARAKSMGAVDATRDRGAQDDARAKVGIGKGRLAQRDEALRPVRLVLA